MGLDRSQDFARSKFVAPTRHDAAPLIPVARRIEAALAETPLVLVVAPAGTGKTTALAAWSQQTTDWRPAWNVIIRPDSPSAFQNLMKRTNLRPPASPAQ